VDLKVEYLVIVETKNSFCSSIGSFNNLLKSHTDITISNGTLKYKEIEINYNVITEELSRSCLKTLH